MNANFDLETFIRNEVKPAMGCTEPVAVALAAAVAARSLSAPVQAIDLELSLNVYKNGRDVGIPGGQGLRGNRIAAAMGAMAGAPDKGLLVLEGLPHELAQQAKAMVEAGHVSVTVKDDSPVIYIRALLHGTDGHRAEAIIQDRHDLVVSVSRDGELLQQADTTPTPAGDAAHPAYLDALMGMDMLQLWDLAGQIDDGLETFLLQGAQMNMAVAEQGLKGNFGLGVGLSLEEHSRGHDALTRAKMLAGAASDVRMSGAEVLVMSSAGSGNHGITAVIPVAVAAEEAKAPPRKLAEALALSHLVTGYLKGYTGRLTPICGCSVAAGAGAAAGIVRVLGGTSEMAEHAVASLVSSLMGMLCDGAKGSCGLKVSAAAGEAYASAFMALDKRGVQQGEGLITPHLQATAAALSTLCKQAFVNMDKVIVSMLQQRPEC